METVDLPKLTVDLSKYDNSGFSHGACKLKRALWFLVNAAVMTNPYNPFYGIKRLALRMFGARLGRGVIIKPGVSVKHPWRLRVGDNVWIGERVWIDNLVDVTIGSNCCISQGAAIITGNHDYKSPAFDLITGAVTLEEGCWVGARATVCAGVTMASHSVLAAGSVASDDTLPYAVYRGNPAVKIADREVVTKR